MSLQFEMGAKKALVTFTPNKTLGEGLTEFCKQNGFDPAQFTLKKGKQNLDLSLTYRLSGLAARATVEVVRISAADVSKEVSIGLQLADGTRLVAKFSPTISLWDLLLHWEKANGINLTRDVSKDGLWRQPCIQYLTKDFSTNSELRQSTLQSLGLTQGNGLLRYVAKSTDLTLEKALALDSETQTNEKEQIEKEKREFEEKKERRLKELEEREKLEKAARERDALAAEEQRKRKLERDAAIQKEIEEEEKKKLRELSKKELELAQIEHDERVRLERVKLEREREELIRQRQYQEFINAENAQKKAAASSQPVVSTKAEEKLTLKREGDVTSGDDQVHKKARVEEAVINRDIQVFAPSATPFDPRSLELPDDFFDTTSEDIARAMEIEKQLKKEHEAEAGTFRTREQRERDRIRKLAKYKKCLLRIRFPDRSELQATFLPTETMSTVYSVVQNALRLDANLRPLSFYLFITPPFQRLDVTNPKPIRDLGLLPASLLHLGLDEGVQAQTPFLKDELISEIREKLAAPVVFTAKKELNFVVPVEKEEKRVEEKKESKQLSEQDKDAKLKNLLGLGKKK